MTRPVPRFRVSRVKTPIRKDEDVTPEIEEIATKLYDEWYADSGRVRWDDFWDRLDGSILADGSEIDLGDQYGTDAMKKIKKHVKRIQREEY